MSNIADWLTSLGLEKYAAPFAEAEIEFDMLPELTDADLVEIGLPVGPRRKIKNAIAALGEATQAATTTPETGPERRHMTVLFVDLVGSSKLAAELDAEDTREVMLAYQNKITEVMRRPEYNGYVAKFMGDGALCYFGWPTAYEDDAERAVKAGLRLVKEVKRLKTVAASPLSCRVGISSGSVVVGDMIGQGASAEHSLVGETANIAARLQDHAEAGQVIVSDRTKRLLGNAFALDGMGPQTLKGIGTPTEAYIARGEAVGRSRFDIQRATDLVPMIGRQDDIDAIRTGWEAVQQGGGRSFIVCGDAGIGKSRLVHEFIEDLPLDETVLLTFQCAPHRQGSAFHPIISRLQRLVGFSEEGSLSDKRATIEAASGTTGDDLDLFMSLLGVDLPEGNTVAAMSPGQRRKQMNRALMDWVFRTAQDKPMVIVFEDLHWVDPTTQELLSGLSAAITDKRVMLLTTSRPEFVDAFTAQNPTFRRLHLERMVPANVANLVARVAQATDVTPEVSKLITERTDGVPLFVEEMTKSLIENGVLEMTEGTVHTQGRLEQRTVPDTLHDILVARLDRLNLAKRTAQVAACFGRDFHADALLPVMDVPQSDLAASLNALVASDLVFQIGVAEDRIYRFKHALLRDAAYGTLLKNDRRALHSRIYAHFAEQDATAPEVLAQHARDAGDLQAAIGHFVKAAEQAQARPAYLEAVGHLDQAIALLAFAREARPEAEAQFNETEMGLQAKRAAVLMVAVGFGNDAVKIGFERALQLSEDFPQSPVRVSIVYGLWVHDFVRGNNRRALVFAEQALATAEKVQNPALLVTTNRMKAIILSIMARFTEAEDLMARAISHFDEAAHRGLGETMGQEIDVAVYAYRAVNLTFIGRTDEALELMQKGVEVAVASGHVPTICHISCHALYPALIAGRFDLLEGYATKYLHLAEEHNIPIWAIYGKLGVAFARLAEREEGAYEEVVAALDSIAALPAQALIAAFSTLLVRNLVEMGQFEKAAEWATKTEALMTETHDLSAKGDLLICRAHIADHHGDKNAAQAALHEAIAFGKESGSPAVYMRAAISGVQLGLMQKAALDDLVAGLAPGDCPHLRPFVQDLLQTA